MTIPSAEHYWLLNAHVPAALLTQPVNAVPTTEHLVRVDLEICRGAIASVHPAGTIRPQQPTVDLRQGQVWPCFVDLHTHLDKGHTWHRAPSDGTFDTALKTAEADVTHWSVEDVYRRMEFGLKCSYAHGTRALRTHIDSADGQATISLEAFQALRSAWADRVTLQAVCLVGVDYFLTPAGEVLADQLAAVQGVLGAVTWNNPDLPRQLDRVFDLARERQLPIDLHVDESTRPTDQSLRLVAEAKLRHQFTGQVVCGHACSLSVQSPEVATQTIALVREAGIGIVSLPMCNLYLQDRTAGRTPRWRGVTLLHELKAAGVPVAIASDNCRDPFYGFGDHDGLEVFSMSVKIAHLDQPYGDWCRAITATPADLMGLPDLGRIGVGLPADLVVFKARTFSELLSRPQSDRLVLRRGQVIDTTLPDYAELDDLVAFG